MLFEFNRRIRNKGQLKAVELVPPQATDLKAILRRAELRYYMGKDIVAGNPPEGRPLLIPDDDDEGGDSASDED